MTDQEVKEMLENVLKYNPEENNKLTDAIIMFEQKGMRSYCDNIFKNNQYSKLI